MKPSLFTDAKNESLRMSVSESAGNGENNPCKSVTSVQKQIWKIQKFGGKN
jgi:hypothetical protein